MTTPDARSSSGWILSPTDAVGIFTGIHAHLEQAQLWWLGLLCEGVGTLFCALGKICWRHAAVSSNNWWYLVGAGLTMGIYPVLDALAYSFASQSLLAVGSGLVVLWNTLLAPRLLKERLTVSRAGGAAIIIVGTVCVALTGRHDNQREHTAKQLANLMLSPLAITYYACAFAWALVLLLVRQAMREPLRRALAQTVLAGSLSGNMFTVKAAMTIIRCQFDAGCDTEGQSTHDMLLDGGALILLSIVVHASALCMFAHALRSGEALLMVAVYDGAI